MIAKKSSSDNISNFSNIPRKFEISGKKIFLISALIFVLIVILIILMNAFYIINAGERGVLLTWGNPDNVPISEGIHFKIPIAQKVVIMDIKTQKYEADLTAASSDLQNVNTKIAINYHLDPKSVPTVYQTIGTDYDIKLIFPLEQESNKAATAQYTAEELITKREQVRTQMENNLRDKLAARGILVESISIIDFAFSPSFTQAIEAKVTAEQNALAAKNKLEQVKYEAEQRVTQAKGEADAIAIQASAINAKGGKDYVQLQAINRWDGQLPKAMLSTGSTPFVDVSSIINS